MKNDKFQQNSLFTLRKYFWSGFDSFAYHQWRQEHRIINGKLHTDHQNGYLRAVEMLQRERSKYRSAVLYYNPTGLQIGKWLCNAKAIMLLQPDFIIAPNGSIYLNGFKNASGKVDLLSASAVIQHAFKAQEFWMQDAASQRNKAVFQQLVSDDNKATMHLAAEKGMATEEGRRWAAK